MRKRTVGLISAGLACAAAVALAADAVRRENFWPAYVEGLEPVPKDGGDMGCGGPYKVSVFETEIPDGIGNSVHQGMRVGAVLKVRVLAVKPSQRGVRKRDVLALESMTEYGPNAAIGKIMTMVYSHCRKDPSEGDTGVVIGTLINEIGPRPEISVW